jgi:hypothetical protein
VSEWVGEWASRSASVCCECVCCEVVSCELPVRSGTTSSNETSAS